VVTAKNVQESKEAKLTFRVKDKGRTGDRQWSYVYNFYHFFQMYRSRQIPLPQRIPLNLYHPPHRIDVIIPFEVITTQRPSWRRIASMRPSPGSTSPGSTSTMPPIRLCNMATPR
jgi:hypothetical protein